MPTDLYSVDLAAISGSDLYKAIAEFTRVDRPIDDRPREGYLLDFKADVGERFVRSVAAMANTFGGILILGVSESDGRPEKLDGITTNGELKTQVASVIASNLVPCPPFEISECGIPGNADGRKLAVVRVRESQEICLIAKKGERNPVYIRVEDQSSPADAFQLRALLTRKRANENISSDVERRLKELETELFVCSYKALPQGSRSPTFFQVVICPNNAEYVALDLADERAVSALITRRSPGLQELATMSEAKFQFNRWRDWFEMRFVENAHDYERRWRVTARADVGFITQVRWPIDGGEYWSLYDVTADLACVMSLAREFWLHRRHYGGFRLRAVLRVGKLQLEHAFGGFGPYFYERISDFPYSAPLDNRAVRLVKSPQGDAVAEVDLDYAGIGESLADTVSSVVNQLVRCLGHTCDLQALKLSTKAAIDWLGSGTSPNEVG
jgi:hypothetical protein